MATKRLHPAPDPARAAALKDLRRIPGIGPAMADDLWRLGFRRVEELRAADPREMYDRLCELDGTRLDPCVLYVFRCAVYFAREPRPVPELLRWWSWKGRTVEGERLPAEAADAR